LDLKNKDDLNRYFRVQHTLKLQVIGDILIENGLTTHEKFKEKYLDKVDNLEITDEDLIKELKKSI
jgi:hypothetical protein